MAPADTSGNTTSGEQVNVEKTDQNQTSTTLNKTEPEPSSTSTPVETEPTTSPEPTTTTVPLRALPNNLYYCDLTKNEIRSRNWNWMAKIILKVYLQFFCDHVFLKQKLYKDLMISIISISSIDMRKYDFTSQNL